MARPRKKPLPRDASIWMRFKPFVLPMLAFILATGTVLYALTDAGQDKLLRFSVSHGYAVSATKISGNKNTAAADIEKAAAVSSGAPLFGIDLKQAQTAITALPWIKSAELYRQLPDTIRIDVTERIPVAILLDAQNDLPALIDETGAILTTINLKSYGRFLAVSGKDAGIAAKALIDVLQSTPDIAVRLKRAERISSRRWDLILDSGARVRLPDDADIQKGLAVLTTLQTEKKILDRKDAVIDLRLPEKPSVH